MCPFCNKQIKEQSVIIEKFCDDQCLENKDHVIVCINCRQIDGYDSIEEFCSFHDNEHKIERISIHHRKYYLEYGIFNLTKKYDSYKTANNRNKINNVLAQIKGDRKRMININFIMKQMLNDMQITTLLKNNQIKENP